MHVSLTWQILLTSRGEWCTCMCCENKFKRCLTCSWHVIFTILNLRRMLFMHVSCLSTMVLYTPAAPPLENTLQGWGRGAENWGFAKGVSRMLSPRWFFSENDTEENGRKQKEKNEKTEENGKKGKRQNGSDTVLATPFAKSREGVHVTRVKYCGNPEIEVCYHPHLHPLKALVTKEGGKEVGGIIFPRMLCPTFFVQAWQPIAVNLVQISPPISVLTLVGFGWSSLILCQRLEDEIFI